MDSDSLAALTQDMEKLHELVNEYIATQAHEWFHAAHPGLRLEWEVSIDTKPIQEVSDGK